MQKPEALTASGRSEVITYKLHYNRFIQPAGGGLLTQAESGKGHRLMQACIYLLCKFREIYQESAKAVN